MDAGGFESQLTHIYALEKEASDMWMSNFFHEEQVPWSDFTFAIKKFVFESLKIELTDVQVEQIIKSIDNNHEKLIHFNEWNSFYNFYWKYEEKRKEILSSPPQSMIEKVSKVIFPFVLKVRKINTNDPKESRYPENHEFFISKDKIEFIDYENKAVTIMKNWEREALIDENETSYYQARYLLSY